MRIRCSSTVESFPPLKLREMSECLLETERHTTAAAKHTGKTQQHSTTTKVTPGWQGRTRGRRHTVELGGHTCCVTIAVLCCWVLLCRIRCLQRSRCTAHALIQLQSPVQQVQGLLDLATQDWVLNGPDALCQFLHWDALLLLLGHAVEAVSCSVLLQFTKVQNCWRTNWDSGETPEL